MNKRDFERLSEMRLEDARVLLNAGRYAGTYYLAGYAVECAIKACIAGNVQEHEFPDKQLANKSHSHKIQELVVVAQLSDALEKKRRESDGFQRNWKIATDWSESTRYAWEIEENTAREMYEAVGSDADGVLSWLKMFW